MTAIEFLKRQHREALAMIKKLEGGDGKLSAADLQVFGKLKSALVFHTAVEEQVFYHELANEEATKHLVDNAYLDHRTVDELLVKLTVAPPDQWPTHLARLKRVLSQHIDEEENDLFPKAEQLLGKSKLKGMGWQMEQIQKGKSANMGQTARVEYV